MTLIEKALEIALDAHKGQKDKNGEPYILRVLDVMMQGRNEIERVCGVLHDVVSTST
jgi:(p)ppGpp synthase/HD superfamily hydrolase